VIFIDFVLALGRAFPSGTFEFRLGFIKLGFECWSFGLFYNPQRFQDAQ
jgi:hypothetical protein